MGRLMVITTPDLAPGFRLAGVEAFPVEDVEEAEETLRRLLAGGGASLIAVRRNLLEGMDAQLQKEIATGYEPVVMAIPSGVPTTLRRGRRRYVTELIRRAIGFQISFGSEAKAGDSER